MKKRVLHFVRKKDQLKASFILNQITNHQIFEPLIAFRKSSSKNKSETFADFDIDKYKYLDLSLSESFFDKLRFKTIKTLSNKHVDEILDFIKENEISICHFHYGTDCGIYYPLTKKLPVPFVVSFYGYDCSSFPSFLLGYGKRFLKERVFRYCSAVFAMSPDMEKDLVAAGCKENRIIVHYYGTDCKKFYYDKIDSENKKVILLNLSTLVPQKGHIFLLKSIKKIIEKGIVNFELRIAGSGELDAELKKFVFDNEIKEFVTFVGAVKYASEQMMDEYRKADVFVHPSVIAPNGDKEGIPGTIIEAMSAGLPVISTYHAGIPYIVASGNTGLLVKEHNEDELALAIISLIQGKELRRAIGAAGQAYAVKNLDLPAKEKELEELYENVLKK